MMYPLPVFHFQVDWGGARGGFTEVSGLDIEVEAIEYRDGSSPVYSPIKIPGLRKHANIVLKRGIVSGDNEFFTWLTTTTRLNQVERRDVIIKLLDDEHQPVVIWKVRSAWVTKLVGPSLKADANEVAIESMELAHEGLTIEHD